MAAAVETPFADAYNRYLGCLDAADEYAAVDIALGLIDAGASAKDVLLGVVAPAQAQVGSWWQRNEWSVAQEHAATHISERVVAAVDCGLVVNPIGVEQQMEGGIIWGISSALKGEITFRGGAATQSSYADFEVARMRDTRVRSTSMNEVT